MNNVWVKASERLPEGEGTVFIRNIESKRGGLVWISELKKMNDNLGLDYVEWLDVQPSQSNVSEDIEKAAENDKKYMDGLIRNYGTGAPNKYQYTGNKCVAGCKNYTGYETYHHKDCPFYPDSFSERFDKLNSEWQKQQDNSAIGFAEWISDNAYSQYYGKRDNYKKWYRRSLVDYREFITTKELYNIYLKSINTK